MLNERIDLLLEEYHLKQQLRQRHGHYATGSNFCTNDYLNLSDDKAINLHFAKAFSNYPVGSSASLAASGHHARHQALEEAFCGYLNTEAALVCSSGYQANLALCSLLAAIDAPCLIDKGIHASVYDGLKQYGVNYRRFRHDDLDHLLNQWKDNDLILTEGIFSMTGKMFEHSSMVPLCMQKSSVMIIDEAHSFGVDGHHGLGVGYHVPAELLPLRIIPLGKAMHGQGAIITGKKSWVDALLQSARSIIYTTATSPAYAEGMRQVLNHVVLANDKRDKLHHNINYFVQQSKHQPWLSSKSPIQYLPMGSSERAIKLWSTLSENNIHVMLVRAPTVPVKKSGIRVSLSAKTSHDDINKLIEHVDNVYKLYNNR